VGKLRPESYRFRGEPGTTRRRASLSAQSELESIGKFAIRIAGGFLKRLFQSTWPQVDQMDNIGETQRESRAFRKGGTPETEST
jgi:hypothetical protein